MAIFGPSSKELDFRKAIEVFNKCTIANCQISSVNKNTVPCGKPVMSGKLPAPPTTRQSSLNGHPGSSRTSVPVNGHRHPENRQTKRMKLHNPLSEPYDCSPCSSHAASSPASYRTALENEPVTSRDPVTSCDPVTSRVPVTSCDPVTSCESDSSPETLVPDTQQHTQVRVVNSITSRRFRSPYAEPFEYGIKRRAAKRNWNRNPKNEVALQGHSITSNLTALWNEPVTSRDPQQPTTSSKSRSRPFEEGVRRRVERVSPETSMSQHMGVFWGDHSNEQFTKYVRRRRG